MITFVIDSVERTADGWRVSATFKAGAQPVYVHHEEFPADVTRGKIMDVLRKLASHLDAQQAQITTDAPPVIVGAAGKARKARARKTEAGS